MEARTEIDEDAVRTLANLAELPLAAGREVLLAPQLAAWIRGANELNRKMSDPEHWTRTPMAVFAHPER